MRYRPVPSPASTEKMIGSINTTPLIDVMLVLLIMFIMIIPVTHHKVPMDLPQGGKAAATEPGVHRLGLDNAGRLSWNGLPMAEAELPAHLAGIRGEATAELHFRIESEARYEDFDRVLATIKRAGVERLGLVDNHRFVEQ